MTSSSTPTRTTRTTSRPRAAATVALALGVLVGVTGCTAAAAGERTRGAATEPETTATLSRALDAAVATGVPGIAVRVDDGSGPVRTAVRQSAPSAAADRLRATDSFKMGRTPRPSPRCSSCSSSTRGSSGWTTRSSGTCRARSRTAAPSR